MHFPDPDQGPGTPYLIANVLPASVLGLMIAGDKDGFNTGVAKLPDLEIFVNFVSWAPFIFFFSVVLNAIPCFGALKFFQFLGYANKQTAIAFGMLLPFFWLLVIRLIVGGEYTLLETAQYNWKNWLLFSVTGGASGWLFMHLYKNKLRRQNDI